MVKAYFKPTTRETTPTTIVGVVFIRISLNSFFTAGDPQAIMKLGGSLGETITGIVGMAAASYQNDAKTADIHSAEADAMMEVLRKMQEENSTQL